MHNLRFRQIHLDFHTSPHIPEIGAVFNKQEWQNALKSGHVNSITCFAVCHHGWSYYNTKVGERHPHLDFDLLRTQFDACKEIDVNVPIYLTAGVNNWAAEKHPEWREIGYDGRYTGWARDITQAGFHKMCFNTPFLDFLCDQIREVARLFPDCDGLFYDIISQGQCCCKWCLKSMDEKGLDAESGEDRKKHARMVLEKYYRKTTAASRELDPDMPVFHNSGHVSRGDRDILKYFSHLELESLPTGGWGYDHFPMGAKYCTNLEHDFLGMTGKFHTTWGEFGGFKHPNALRYECAAMIAYNAKCSVGDQLHPCGKLDESTYKLIGAAYKEVEEKEVWCQNTESVADLAVLSSVAINPAHPREDEDSDVGVTRILLESHILFDIIDAEMDFSKYKMIILPDDIFIDCELKKLLDSYLAQGGKLLLTGKSGLNVEETEFLFDVGAAMEGPSEFSPDYILPAEDLRADFVDSPSVCYTRSYRVKVTDGESLGDIYDPYFNRSYKHFCSHQHTPNKLEASGFACGVRKNNIMYLAHPVFIMYRGFGAVAVKEYVVNCIKKLLGEDLSLITNLPSTARVTLNRQPAENRSVLHLLSANTILRGGKLSLSGGNLSRAGNIEVIEELLPLYNTEVTLKTTEPVKSISLEPQGKELDFERAGNKVKLKIDEFTCHQMIVLNH